MALASSELSSKPATHYGLSGFLELWHKLHDPPTLAVCIPVTRAWPDVVLS